MTTSSTTACRITICITTTCSITAYITITHSITTCSMTTNSTTACRITICITTTCSITTCITTTYFITACSATTSSKFTKIIQLLVVGRIVVIQSLSRRVVLFQVVAAQVIIRYSRGCFLATDIQEMFSWARSYVPKFMIVPSHTTTCYSHLKGYRQPVTLINSSYPIRHHTGCLIDLI
jgi:hypothetical protein